jgi:hypothetical protein
VRHLTGVLVAASLVASSAAHADDIATAQALFDKGIADLQAGHVDAACKELRDSLVAHDDSGTKGALATCYGQQDKLASAWGLWKDLADTAPRQDMKDEATKQAAALEPKLAHYVLKAAAPVPGTVVTVNGTAVRDLSVSVPLPVDAGTVALAANAPGYKPWTGSAKATDGQLTTIDVPALIPEPKATPGGGPVYDPAVAAEEAESRHKRHLVAIGAAGVGVAAVIVGGVFGASASSDFDTAKKDCGGNINACPGTSIGAARSAFNSANSAATLSTVMFIVGGAAIAGGAVLWFTAPNVEEQPPAGAVSWRLAPTLDPHGAGLVFGGGF